MSLPQERSLSRRLTRRRQSKSSHSSRFSSDIHCADRSDRLRAICCATIAYIGHCCFRTGATAVAPRKQGWEALLVEWGYYENNVLASPSKALASLHGFISCQARRRTVG